MTEDGAQVIAMPCVGMLPPSFIDFALARDMADGVMITGCSDGDCFFRLGSEWTRQRLARERDPFLRQRVDRTRLTQSWLPPNAKARRRRALQAFRASLAEHRSG